MGSRGQATIESLGVAACVVVLSVATGVALVRSGRANTIAAAIGITSAQSPEQRLSNTELRLTSAALGGGPGALRLDDAVQVVALRVGRVAADRLVSARSRESLFGSTGTCGISACP